MSSEAGSLQAAHRLPRNVIPRRYDLELDPDLEAFTFTGRVSAAVTVIEQTDAIVLNAAELDIDRAVLVDVSGSTAMPASVTFDAAAERATLRFADRVAPGEWRLDIDFRGTLNDRLRGFYRSTYTDPEGRSQVLATTQFEATDARRAFPCWDEPDLKAVFGVTLIVPDGMVGISCGPVVEDVELDDGRHRVVFADTMPLSTYLVAFIVGDLEVTEPVAVDGVPLRIATTPGKGHLAGFALEAGAHALRFFTDYYGIPYPGDKLDMIAIPDFSAGAMENLGAVTYRESALLIDPHVATRAELQRVAAVIAHEIAHMWFGVLVTMRWWNGTWLKEAFATFMEMKCTDVFRPEWNTWLAFGPSRDAAMEIDALATTRSVEFPVGSPDDANAMFDTITYKKGSAVLRMLEQYLGEETFQRGVAKYLTHHAYDNTETSDLWDALESASGEPVRAIADDWIFQGGLPEVRVEAVDGGVRLGHLCFRYLGAADHTWKVPVRYRDGDGHERVLVDDDVVIQSNAPVIVNARGAGFYRTRYAPPLLAAVAGRFGELDDGERFCLVADTWAAVLAGGVAAGDFLDLITRLRTETEPAVWQAALNGLDELDRIASPDDRPRLQAFVRDLLAARVAALGWHPAADEPERAPQLRGVLLEAMGSLGGDQATQVQARAVLERAFDAPEAVDADVAAAALGVVAATGGRDDFASFIVAWASTESPQVRVRMLRAAAAVPDPGTARELLAMVIDGRIRRQDAYWVVARLLGHRDTGVAVWAEIKARWNEALDAMPPRNARMMLDLIHHRSEPHVAADIAAWLSANPIKGSEQLVAQQLERLQVRVALREREAPRLATALAALESASTPT